MIGAEEKRKLMSQMTNEPIYPLIAVLKCLAALIVLVIIAAGPWAFLATNNPSGTESRHPQPDASLAESKRVFDERRRAHEAAQQGGASDRVTAAGERLAID